MSLLQSHVDCIQEYPLSLIRGRYADTYGWNSPGRTSLLGECHQNVRTWPSHALNVNRNNMFFCVWSEIST